MWRCGIHSPHPYSVGVVNWILLEYTHYTSIRLYVCAHIRTWFSVACFLLFFSVQITNILVAVGCVCDLQAHWILLFHNMLLLCVYTNCIHCHHNRRRRRHRRWQRRQHKRFHHWRATLSFENAAKKQRELCVVCALYIWKRDNRLCCGNRLRLRSCHCRRLKGKTNVSILPRKPHTILMRLM